MAAHLLRSLIHTVLFIGVVALTWILLDSVSLGDLGGVDFLQYWAGSKALLSGQNPYDASVILPLEKAVWTGPDKDVLLWNPPLIFTFSAPFSLLSFQHAKTSWLLFIIIALSASVLLTLRETLSDDASRRMKIAAFAFLLSFYPFSLMLFYGQSSHIALFGFTLFLLFTAWSGKRCDSSFVGGMLLSLTLIKPHLLYLLYLFIFFRSLKTRKWETLGGLFGGAFLLAILPLLIDPHIYAHYANAAGSPPLYWKTPTLGSFLQELLHSARAIIRFFPTIITGVLFCLWMVAKETRVPEHVALLWIIPVSLFTSPYGWVYDQALLFPIGLGILAAADTSHRFRAASLLLLGANALMCVWPHSVGQEYFLWYPMVFGAAGAMMQRKFEIAPS